MGVVLILAVLLLAFLVGRFSVQVVKYQKQLDALTERVASLDHSLDRMDQTLDDMRWQGAERRHEQS